MPVVHVDFTETQDFDPLPTGAYEFLVLGTETAESGPNSKNPGSIYLKWELEVEAAGDPALIGKKHLVNSMLQGPGAFTTRNMLQALDPDNADKYKGQTALEFDTDDFQGKRFGAEVECKPGVGAF